VNRPVSLIVGSTQRRAVFLDRDGTINREVNWLRDPSQIELLPGVAEAIRRLRADGFLAVVITNQSVVARGLCDEEGLARIHERLGLLLAAEGAALDGVYFCPHHPGPMPDSTRPELIRACDCRKPGIALIRQACTELGIDPRLSWMCGDKTVDVRTGENAGLRSLLLRCGYGGNDGQYAITPWATADTLLGAAELILKETRR